MNGIKSWCKNSLTIFWASLQVAAGFGLTVAAITADFAQNANIVQYMPSKWSTGTLIAMGVITEDARRRKEWQK